MISYEKFWQTLKAKNISQYKLSVYYGVSNSQINRIKKGSIYQLQLLKICAEFWIAELKILSLIYPVKLLQNLQLH